MNAFTEKPPCTEGASPSSQPDGEGRVTLDTRRVAWKDKLCSRESWESGLSNDPRVGGSNPPLLLVCHCALGKTLVLHGSSPH